MKTRIITLTIAAALFAFAETKPTIGKPFVITISILGEDEPLVIPFTGVALAACQHMGGAVSCKTTIAIEIEAIIKRASIYKDMKDRQATIEESVKPVRTGKSEDKK